MVRAWVLENIDRFQLKQYEHDADSHQDLATALLPKRITHFTLHFSKYQGAIADYIISGDKARLEKSLVDTMVIALSASNAMNFCASEKLQNIQFYESAFNDVGEGVTEAFLLEYVSIVGRMAKACEVLDHLESYPSREVLEESVVKIIALTDSFSCKLDFNVWNKIENRWKDVEESYVINKLKKMRDR